MRISAGWNSLSAPATEQMKEDYQPGEIGFDPLGLLPTDAEAKYELQTKEINNGRLAMISIGAPLSGKSAKAQPPQPHKRGADARPLACAAGFAVQEEVDHITIWRGACPTLASPAAHPAI